MQGMGLVLDILIVALLGATIFYAMRLSRNLDAFRSNRSDMERLIRELSSQITRAQEGVTALDDAAKESGEELRTLLQKARGMIDELTLMTEAGDSLAGRLENLATRNRSMVDELGSTAASLVYPSSKTSAPVVPSSFAEKYSPDKRAEPSYREPPAAASPFFSIRDPDFDADEKPATLGSALSKNIDLPGTGDGASDLESQAERDLASALRKRRPRSDT